MKQHRRIALIASIFSSTVLLASPLLALADDPPPLPALAPIIITEVQPGSAESASAEFIELYNTTDQPIDFAAHHWQLQIASSSAAGWEAPYRTVDLSGTIGPDTYYIAASKYTSAGQAVQYLPNVASDWFSAGLAATAGHVRLVYSTNQPSTDGTACVLAITPVDEVEWSTVKEGAPTAPSLDKRTPFVAATSGGIANASSLQRVSLAGSYIDTNNDAVDFALGAATPAHENVVPDSDPTLSLPTALPDLAPPPTDQCQPPAQTGGQGGETSSPDQSGMEPAIPPVDSGLLASQITELLPNPAAPGTDENDEFIELYNFNDTPFDLSGFVLQTGLTTRHTYTFPEGSALPPNSFTAFYSRDTGLSLSNSGSRAVLLDPSGALLDQTAPYGAAKEGEVWELIGSGWQWSTTPTPDEPNILTTPIVAVSAIKQAAATAAKTAAKSTKTSAKTTTESSGSVKGSSTKKSTKAKAAPKTTSKPVAAVAATADKPKFNPLQPGVLAVAGAFAILYGAYEYRHDMANKLRNFRANRATRRKGG